MTGRSELPVARAEPVESLSPAEAPPRRIFVRDLVLPARIGIYPPEKTGPQRVRINLDVETRADGHPLADDFRRVICYEGIVNGIRAIIDEGHLNLVETLAERIAAMCLEDPRCDAVTVRVEKLDAIPEAAGVGVEVLRKRAGSTG